MRMESYRFLKKMSVIGLTGVLIGMSFTSCKSTSDTQTENVENSNSTGDNNNSSTENANSETNSLNAEKAADMSNGGVSGDENQSMLTGNTSATPDAPVNSNGLNGDGAINGNNYSNPDGPSAGNAVSVEDPSMAPVPPNTMAGNVSQDPFAPQGAETMGTDPSALPLDPAPTTENIAAAPDVTVPVEPPTNQSLVPPPATEGQESGEAVMSMNEGIPNPEAPLTAQNSSSSGSDTEATSDSGTPQSDVAQSTEASNNESTEGHRDSTVSHNHVGGLLPEDGTVMPYYIKAGDTLASIAEKIYGKKGQWKHLASINNLANPNTIYVGDIIYYKLNSSARAFAEKYEGIPKQSFTVRQGDTLSKIAKEVFGSQRYWRTLWKLNPTIKNPDRIRPGDTVVYPSSKQLMSSLSLENQEVLPSQTLAQSYMNLP